MRTAITMLCALMTLSACFDSDDSRRLIVELECSDSECLGRWDGSDSWSAVLLATEIERLPGVEPDGLWQCEPDPDVDLCVVVDSNDHVGCFRVQGELAMAVAPTCAVPDDGWMFVGVGMSAAVVR